MAILNNYLKPIADAIRSKTGKVGSINAQNFASEIGQIVSSEEAEASLKVMIEGGSSSKSTQFVIPYGVTKIQASAFGTSNASEKPSVSYTKMPIIPDSVTNIGKNAFSNVGGECSRWNVEGDKNIEAGTAVFSYKEPYNLIFGSNITQLGERAFQSSGINGIIHFTEDCLVTSIPENCFNSMYGVRQIIIDNGANIDDSSFYNIKSYNDHSQMNELHINNIGTVYYSSFRSCTFHKVYIKSILQAIELTFPYSTITDPTTIRPIISLNIPKSNNLYKEGDGIYLNGELMDNNLLVVPETATVKSRLTGMNYFKYVKILPNWDRIPDMFLTNSTVEKVDFSPSNTCLYILDKAFMNCTNLNVLKIPSSVTTIKSYALQIGSSSNKATIIFEGTTPPSIQSNTFNTSYLNKIIVPKGTSDTFKAATNWSSFASYIIEPLNVSFNVDSSLLNNENITYQIDNGAEQQFTDSVFIKENMASLKIKNNTGETINIGTTNGGSEIGSVATGGSLQYTFDTDTTIYISQA